MCNDFERQIEWRAYCEALEQAKLGLSERSEPTQLQRADDTRVNDVAPIMRTSGNAVELAQLRWGFKSPRPGAAPVFNFRSEGRSFRKSNRCLIPASAFFEFTGKASPKTKWRFELTGSPIMAIAGLWREGDADHPAAFTMLTTAPGPDIAPFHNRQIAVLPICDWGAWLYLERSEAELLRPLPTHALSVAVARTGRDAPDIDLLRLARTK